MNPLLALLLLTTTLTTAHARFPDFFSCLRSRKVTIQTPLSTPGSQPRLFIAGDLHAHIPDTSLNGKIWPARIAYARNYEFINTACETTNQQECKPGETEKVILSENLADQVQYILSKEKKQGDIVIMSISEDDRWFRVQSSLNNKQTSVVSSEQKLPSQVVDDFNVQMERLLGKQYRVFVTTIPPYDKLPAMQPPNSLTSDVKVWIEEVNQELESRITSRNKIHHATNPASISHVHVIDIHAGTLFQGERTDQHSWRKTLDMTNPRISGTSTKPKWLFYDNYHFDTPWHKYIAQLAMEEIDAILGQ